VLDSITHLFQSQPFLFIIYTAFFGLFIGSFLNVVILRLPVMLHRSWETQCLELQGQEPSKHTEKFNLVVPRSRCPKCNHQISAYENIPVLSYLIQRGHCKHCNNKISPRYPSIELLTALLSGIVAWHYGFSWEVVFALLLTWALISLSFIDIDHQILPDDITLPFLWLGLGLSLFGIFTEVHSSIIGAMAGYLSLWLVYQLFKLITGKEGMGYGDFKLLALFGAWFGWQILPLTILLSSFVGAVIGISMIVFMGRDRQIPIPFGPYLALAGWIAMMWGDDINSAYLAFLAN
jgi:leader peptidase (prepilin peptidase) / N-methyltransferase